MNYCLMENRPIRARRDHEAELAKKHERERLRLEAWQERSKYYEKYEKQNAMYEQMTSPRYFEESNRQHKELKNKRVKAEVLEERREKLRQLFQEDQQTYDIEVLMTNCTPRSWDDEPVRQKDGEIPVELLRKVNDGIKIEEEERRRHRAESALYERWKRDEKVLQECRRMHNLKEIKMSWLDQQIQKQMAKEKEEEELKQQLKLSKKLLEEQKQQEEVFKKEAAEKVEVLQAGLKQQMADILKREEEAKELRRKEEEIHAQRMQLQDLECKWEEEERRRRTKQIAIENQQHHKRKLQLKAQQVLEELESDRKFMEELKQAELCEKVLDAAKRRELQCTMNAFLGLVNDLKSLEAKRRNHMEFTFDSEVPSVFRQFSQAWQMEEEKKQKLMRTILADLKDQINANLKKVAEEQQAELDERKTMLKRIEEQKEEMDNIKLWEKQKMEEYKKCLKEQIATKRQKELDLKKLERDKNREEFERLRNEEIRLKNEIMRMQKGQSSVPTYGRRNFFY